MYLSLMQAINIEKTRVYLKNALFTETSAFFVVTLLFVYKIGPFFGTERWLLYKSQAKFLPIPRWEDRGKT